MDANIFNSFLRFNNLRLNAGSINKDVDIKKPEKYIIPKYIFPISIILEIPAINGIHGESPVNNPTKKGIVFDIFLLKHIFPFLSDSLNPLIPHVIRKIAISIFKIKLNLI